MKQRRLNNAAFLFILLFSFVTVLLHKKEGPLNPLNLHETAILTNHYALGLSKAPSFGREQHNQKFERKKLRIRYKGSEVSFYVTVTSRSFSNVPYISRNFSLHVTPREPLHLQHIAALRAPPSA